MKTYCSGKGLECDGLGNCSICGGVGVLPSNQFYTASRYANQSCNPLDILAVSGLSTRYVDQSTTGSWGDKGCKHCFATGPVYTKYWTGYIRCLTCNAEIVEFKYCTCCSDSEQLAVIESEHACHACDSSGKTAGCRHQCRSPHQYCTHEKTSKHD